MKKTIHPDGRVEIEGTPEELRALEAAPLQVGPPAPAVAAAPKLCACGKPAFASFEKCLTCQLATLPQNPLLAHNVAGCAGNLFVGSVWVGEVGPDWGVFPTNVCAGGLPTGWLGPKPPPLSGVRWSGN